MYTKIRDLFQFSLHPHIIKYNLHKTTKTIQVRLYEKRFSIPTEEYECGYSICIVTQTKSIKIFCLYTYIYIYVICCIYLLYVELWYLRKAYKTGLISIFMASVRFFVYGQEINIYVDVLIYSI